MDTSPRARRAHISERKMDKSLRWVGPTSPNVMKPNVLLRIIARKRDIFSEQKKQRQAKVESLWNFIILSCHIGVLWTLTWTSFAKLQNFSETKDLRHGAWLNCYIFQLLKTQVQIKAPCSQADISRF
jgi:hypothetical protein